jgi:hypothetical protein
MLPGMTWIGLESFYGRLHDCCWHNNKQSDISLREVYSQVGISSIMTITLN